MFAPGLIALLALGYVGLLFALAWWGDRLPDAALGPRTRALVYSLSLAVYCTSWTFYGAVGSAAAEGWMFAAIYLGPALVWILAFDLIRRIAVLSHEHCLTSVADFIAFRFGKSAGIGALITVAALVGLVPYLALQLKAVTAGLVALASRPESLSQGFVGLVLALALGVFSILFGARRLEANEHHRGMVLAIAFESLVKLLAFALVGLWALYAVLGGGSGLVSTIAEQPALRQRFMPTSLPSGFWIQTLLAGAAIICLPRQFHVSFVENERIEDLDAARWLFPVYLLLFTLLAVPIAVAGLSRLGDGAGNADLFMLTLPIAEGQSWLALLSFVGGFSAATGMVIVATVALATMVSNDLIAPLLMRLQPKVERSLGSWLLTSRRITILALALASWLYFVLLGETGRLASLGLISFAAVAQFAPALVLGVYWRGASREGALAGLSLGLFGWLLMIFLPTTVGGWPVTLKPTLETATLISLAINLLALVGVSLWVRRRRPTLPMLLSRREPGRAVTVGELRRLASRLIGAERVDLAFANALDLESPNLLEGQDPRAADVELVGFTERLLAGCIGSASARSVLTAGLRQTGMDTAQALALLEQTSSAIRFNRDLLEATLDHIEQGVSVVDADLRLVSWNRAYIELLGYPPSMVYLGQPVEALIRYNLARELGGDPERLETAVTRRLHHMRRGTSYRYERQHGDGRVIEIRGNPMPKGGYVTTYTDITDFKQTEIELKSAYETMEQQVARRTRELRATLAALEEAKRDAEQANQSKTRFLAAASHDLLQPMNAARLFASNLVQHNTRLPADQARLVRRLDHCLEVAEELLSALLDISRLDQGALTPNFTEVSAPALLRKIERQFSALAEHRNLRLRVRPLPVTVYSDARLLQRVLFNLVNNALKYTRKGGVLIGCRRRGGRVRFEVWDTGPGIAETEQERIFEEFERLATDDAIDAQPGLGLGLSICRRISRVLDVPLELGSRVGRGSVFAISVPGVDAQPALPDAVATVRPAPRVDGFDRSRVLCIDDDTEILDGMRMLLERWGCSVETAPGRAGAIKLAEAGFCPELIIADYHLDHGDDGIAVSLEFNRRTGQDTPVLVLTADREDDLGARVEQLGFVRLLKPVKPAALRAMMRHLLAESGEPLS